MQSNYLRMKNLNLHDVGGFHQLDLRFDSNLNILCGPNGVGKTTVLDAIASAFVDSYHIPLRRRSSAEKGFMEYCFDWNNKLSSEVGEIKSFLPNETSKPFPSFTDAASHLIYIKSSRDFSYTTLAGVMRDPDRALLDHQQGAINGISVTEIKQWFSNRYLMEPHGANWPHYRLANLELAKMFFSLLDPDVRLSHVDSASFDIYLDTRAGKIPFEYMSAGFRTAYALLIGILKEIEFRKLEVTADDFAGLLLIDELDLHLHPTWHGKMLNALINSFPKAQLIVSTHSPHMLQHARPESLLILSKDGMTPRKLEGVDSEFGLIGWTVEEILRDVMGMDDPRPEKFARMMEAYESAVTRRDHDAIAVSKANVLRALHPSSVIRQIIEIETL